MPRLHSAIGAASSPKASTHPTVAHRSTTGLRWIRRARWAALIAAWALVYAAGARGEAAPAYEGFDYPVGTPYSGLTGGTNFVRIASNVASTVAPGTLSDPTGTLLTSGNHLEGSGTLL